MDIRNFCIIAHTDHGKSTLADRLIEVTGTVAKRDMRDQLLDQLDLERERGITIKLQPIRMQWTHSTPRQGSGQAGQEDVQLNLIDTPGHTDFRYEVTRSLAACEGAILLVDATQGIQAQTLATLTAARDAGLTIIPVVNKIDLPAADVPRSVSELSSLLSCSPDDVLTVSGKVGTNVPRLLDAVLDRIPPPLTQGSAPARALIFDAVADAYRGVVAYIRMVEGALTRGDTVTLLYSRHPFEVLEVGSFDPKFRPEPSLREGEIGYVVTGQKDIREVRVGDTIATDPESPPLPGFRELQPMVFASLYPTDAEEFAGLRTALEKLQLNDAALQVEPEHNAALGNGFRCGFLGLLHLDIVQERLEREHGCTLIVTAPSVQYDVALQARRPADHVRSSLLRRDEPNVARISTPADFPDRTVIAEIREPWVRLEVVSPAANVGGVMTLVTERRGVYLSHTYLEGNRALLHFEVPLQGVIVDLFDRLKSVTSGYGSMSYDLLGMRPGDLVKMDILLLGEPVDALSTIVTKEEAHRTGEVICRRLKEVIPKQQFPIPIQAAIGGKIVARETLSAYRKDVTGYLYGGDRTRKDKLLDKQKKGKKRLKQVGRVVLPQEAFLSILQR